MATITASATGGAWNTNAAWVGSVQPTAADDVLLTATSGNISIATGTTALCRSLVCTGFTGNLTFNTTTSQLSIGDGSGGALTLVSTMGLVLTGVGKINFVSTSNNGGTGWTVTTGGKTLPQVTFNGAGGKWINGDAMTCSGAITVTTGTWDTTSSNYAIQAPNLVYTGSSTKAITLNGSTVTLTLAGTPVNGVTTGTTWSGASATLSLTMTGAATLTTGALSGTAWGTITANAPFALVFSSALTIGTLNRNTTAADAGIELPGTLTVTTLWNVGGSADNYMLVNSSAYGTQRTLALSGATITCVNCIFEDIAVTGTTLTGTLIGDAGNISGITASASVTQYQRSAGSEFCLASNWSLTSGGGATGRVPLPQDDAVIDVNSSAALLFTGVTHVRLRSLTVTKANWVGGNPSLSCTFYLHGNLTWASTSTCVSSLFLKFRRANTTGGVSSRTITSNGAAVGTSLGIDILTGSTVALADSLNQGGSVSHTSGTFTVGAYTLTCSSLSCTGTTTRTLNVTDSTIVLTGTGTVWNVNSSAAVTLTSNAASLVDITDTSGTSRAILSGKAWSGTFRYIANNTAACTLDITDANTTNLGTLIVNNGGSTFQKTVRFTSAKTHTVTDLQIIGSVATPIILKGITAASAATLTKASGTITVTNVTMQDLTATGGATWNAVDSTNVSNNTGWTFLNTASASLSLSGSADSAAPAAAGATLSLAGSAVVAAPATATATFVLAGSATPAAAVTATAALDLAAAASVAVALAASGALALDASATLAAAVSASGALDLTAISGIAASPGATGALALDGTTEVTVSFTATAALNLTATAALAAAVSASGALALNGAADASAAAAAAAALALVATMSAVSPIASSGVLDLAASAAVQALLDASATLELAGSAAASSPMQTAAVLVLQAAGDGAAVAAAQALLSLTAIAAIDESASAATGSGSLDLTASASAAVAVTAAAVLALAASAEAVPLASAAGSLTLNAEAAVAAAILAAATIALTGSASPAAVEAAQAFLSLTAGADAKVTLAASGHLVLAATLLAASAASASGSLELFGTALAIAIFLDIDLVIGPLTATWSAEAVKSSWRARNVVQNWEAGPVRSERITS